MNVHNEREAADILDLLLLPGRMGLGSWASQVGQSIIHHRVPFRQRHDATSSELDSSYRTMLLLGHDLCIFNTQKAPSEQVVSHRGGFLPLWAIGIPVADFLADNTGMTH